MRAPSARASGVLSYFARHPTAANLLMVVLIALGLAALPNMRAQFFPDVISDDVDVAVIWPDAGAEDVDAAIVQVLEPALAGVDGVVETVATARAGRATITLEFEPGIDGEAAEADVASVLEGVSDLPEGAEDPEIVSGRWSDRVTYVVISGPVDRAQLARFADEFSARLFDVGVTRVSIQGELAPETLVEVTAGALMRYDVTMRDIADAIGREATTDPAGDVADGTARVRTGAERRSPAEIAAVVLRSRPDGTALTVGDVARVTAPDATGRETFVSDNPAISLQVSRSAAGDAIAIQETVEEVVAAYAPLLPAGTRIDLTGTLSESISARIDLLVDNALTGLALVVGLLFLFLNARTAIWVAAGIPVALLTALAAMYAAGLTINMISLFALIITLGIVVDDAIVVGEHADYRHRTLGEHPVVAAENAARRMFTPVLAATVTTVIAFFALVVIGGRFGRLIADIPFTVIAVLIASLIECFVILPRHMAHALEERRGGGLIGAAAGVLLAGALAGAAAVWALGAGWAWDAATWRAMAFGAAALGALFLILPHAAKLRIVRALRSPWYDAPSAAVNRVFDVVRARAFIPFMRLVVTARYAVLAGALLLLAMQVAVFVRGDVSWRFFSAPEQGSVTGNFAMLPGATRADTEAMMREMQRATEAVGAAYAAEHGRDPVAFAMGEVGANAGRGLGGNRDADLLGAISIELIDADLRPYSSRAFTARLQDEVRQHPLTETVSFRSWGRGPGGDSLSVRLRGTDSATLKAAAEDLKTSMAAFPEVTGLDDSLPYDKEELILDLTPQGRALGFDVGTLGRELSARLGGIEAASFPVEGRSATVRVELPAGERGAGFLERTMLRASTGEWVPLADVVSVERRVGFGSIRRENGARVVTVSGDIDDEDAAAAEAVNAALTETILPDLERAYGIETSLSGLAEQERAFLSDALLGFLGCLLGIYLVLSWIFASWTRPVVIMAIIPFGLVGTIYGHAAWDVPLSMFTVVGLLGMTGIVINDSIVLVTTIDEKARTRALVPAIVEGAADRLRPVLLTTMTTVLGLMPLLFERSQQAQFLKPTVITLVYGLGFGMVLVLLIVPALIAMQRDVGRARVAARRALSGRAGIAGVAAWTLALGAAALFGATVGPMAILGTTLGPVRGLTLGMTGALGVFVAGVVVLALAIWLVAALTLAIRRRTL